MEHDDNTPRHEALLTRMDEELRLRAFSRNSRRLYLAHVGRFYRQRNSENVRCSSEELRQWLLTLMNRGLSFSYVNQALSALRFLHTHVLHEPAPTADLPRPRRPRTLPAVLNREEVRRLMNAIRNQKHRALAVLIYASGIRVGEAVRLRVQDIDGERGRIHVRDGKGRKDRYAMLSEVALEELRRYWRLERPHHWLFPGERRDRHMHIRTVQRIISRAAKRAGIRKKVTPHTLRHSFATHLLEAGTDIRYIQRLLGHKKTTTTEIYTHVADRELLRIKSPADVTLGNLCADEEGIRGSLPSPSGNEPPGSIARSRDFDTLNVKH